MKQKLIQLSRRYTSELRIHLRQGARGNLRQARGIGRAAVALGLETLDMVKMHENALAALEASRSRDGIITRAEMFFTDAVTPIENTHRAALKANAHLHRVSKRLDRRTLHLAASNQFLKSSVVARKTVEKALKKSGENSKRLLAESRRLQQHLQRVTHRILIAQEHKRKKMSRNLQDEIAQTLLGINVRLLVLRNEASANAKTLEREIAITQRLINQAAKHATQFARDIGRSP